MSEQESPMKRALWAMCLAAVATASPLGEFLPRPGLAAQEVQAKTVRLIVDYGDGVEKHFAAIPWKLGMTVLDALEFASRHPRGVKFKYTGAEATAFVTEIDDLKNEGGAKRNWTYRVNDKLGARSCGVAELKESDRVLWRFGKYRPDEKS
jgi:hypothetical protein